MTSDFNEFTKQIAYEIIAMSGLLDNKMETWADVFARHPDSQNANASAGFIMNETNANVIEVVIDVQTLADTGSALLRTKAIETVLDSNGNERFNNISLSYAVDYAIACQLVEKAVSITREDISQLLLTETSRLAMIVVSDQTGRDKASERLLGKRYDLTTDDLITVAENTAEKLKQVLNIVLARLKQTVTRELNT